MVKEQIVIIGAGGFGREVLALIDGERYIAIGFIDTHPCNHSSLSVPILGNDSLLTELKGKGIASCACVAVGNNSKRQDLFEKVLKSQLALPPIIHSSATILTIKSIGEGAIIYPNVVIMTDCKIGNGVLVNAGVTLGHDVELGDFSAINPGAHVAGNVIIGQRVLIGIGTTILENLQIGDDAVIGAGSVVLKDVPSGVVVYGVPARIAQSHVRS